MKHRGSCHCKTVQFEVEAPEILEAVRCNCSMCTKTGYVHLIVPLSKFVLLSGKEAITTYTFNTGVAKHTFCKLCGTKPFYTPRSNPDGVSVNVNCLEPVPRFQTRDFDGQNWEAHAHEIQGLSRE